MAALPGGAALDPADGAGVMACAAPGSGVGEGPAGPITPLPLTGGGPVLSFLSPASALLSTLQQQDEPLARMSQADKAALSLAGAFCCSLVQRMDHLGLLLGPCHRPSVQPSTAAKLWGPSAAEAEAAADGDAEAAAVHTAQRQEDEAERILRPLKRCRDHVLGDTGTNHSSGPCLLTDLPVELLHSICLSKTMCNSEGGRGLALLSRTCTVFGKAATKGGQSLVSNLAQTLCRDGGVRRLPLTMGDFWCWPRMLSWLSQAVRVDRRLDLKTINDGVAAALEKNGVIQDDGEHLVEGSVLVLVEPGVYEERVWLGEEEADRPVRIWACDRGSESDNGEQRKVEWRSRDKNCLVVYGESSFSVNGMTMSAVQSEGYDDDINVGSFNCVRAEDGATLSLERCDLSGGTSQRSIVEVSDDTTTAVISCCCIHDGKRDGVVIYGGASASLEFNNVHSNGGSGVLVEDEGSHVVLRNNRIHDMEVCGVFIRDGASATLENNTISDNGLSGVEITDQSTATLTGNTIKGNGQCKIEPTEEELERLGEASKLLKLAQCQGSPGVMVNGHSNVSMPPGSNNTIEGNGKPGCTAVEQVTVDETSSRED